MVTPGTSKRTSHAKFLALALILSAAAFVCASIAAQPAATPKRVLVLYWDNKDFPGNVMFDASFKHVIESAQPGAIEYYPEYMEVSRFPGQDQSFFKEYLRQKYSARPIDVVVATADIPLNFLVQHRSELFVNAPLVF